MRAAALPGGVEFFAAWLHGADTHVPLTAPPEPPLLRDYQPEVLRAGRLRRAPGVHRDPDSDRRHARRARGALRALHRLRAAGVVSRRDMRSSGATAMAALRDAGFHAADANGREALVAAMSKPERDRGATHPAYSLTG